MSQRESHKCQLGRKDLDNIIKLKSHLKNAIDVMPSYKEAIFRPMLSKYKMTKKCLCDVLDGNIVIGQNKPIDGEYIVIPRNGTIEEYQICSGGNYPSDQMFVIKTNDAICSLKFLYHYMTKNDAFAQKKTKQNVTINILNRMKLEIPSIEDQKKIVSEMDRCDAVIDQKLFDELDEGYAEIEKAINKGTSLEKDNK